ncbi:MAG: AraC family transcriptional regulator, partial [Alphaproteobacteria bacterium]
PSLAERVAERLRGGIRDQAAVAAGLGMSVATLRRRLDGEGTCFRALRRHVLADAAQAMLRQGMHVAEVADQLGFADFRSFTRAFKHWTGMTPAHFRRLSSPPAAP